MDTKRRKERLEPTFWERLLLLRRLEDDPRLVAEDTGLPLSTVRAWAFAAGHPTGWLAWRSLKKTYNLKDEEVSYLLGVTDIAPGKRCQEG